MAPYLIVDGARRTLDFLKSAFGAVELRSFPGTEPGTLMHAEVRIDDTVVMLGDGCEGRPAIGAHVRVYVPDDDDAAFAAGATAVQEPIKMQDEDKRGDVKDAGDTTWWIATKVERHGPGRK